MSKQPEEIIVVDGQKHTIALAPLTIVAPAATVSKISYPERQMIDFEMTMYHAQRVQNLHHLFTLFWNAMGEATNTEMPKITPALIKMQGTGFTHLVGLIDLSLKFIDMKVVFGWKYPETCLHAGMQGGLADLLILIQAYQEGSTEVLLTSSDKNMQQLGKAMVKADRKKKKPTKPA